MAIGIANYQRMMAQQEAYQRAQRQQQAPQAATGIAGGGSQQFQQALQQASAPAAQGGFTSTSSYSAQGPAGYADDPRISPIIAALGAQATISDADVRARTSAGLEGARNLANMNIDKMSQRNAASRGLSGRDGVSDQYRSEISAPILAALAAEEGRASLQGYDQRAGVGMGLLGSLNSSQNARNQLAMQQQQFEFQRQQAEQQRQQQMALQQQIASQAGRPMGPSLAETPGWNGGENSFLNGGSRPGGGSMVGGGFNPPGTTGGRAPGAPQTSAEGLAALRAEQQQRAEQAQQNRPANAGGGYSTGAQTANRPLPALEAQSAIRSALEGVNTGYTGGGINTTYGGSGSGATPYGNGSAGGSYNAGGYANNVAQNTANAAGGALSAPLWSPPAPGASMW